MVTANVHVEDPMLVLAEYDLYLNVGYYSSLVNCGVSVVILLLTLYVCRKLYLVRKTINDLPIYFGSIGPTIGFPSALPDIEDNLEGKKANPPYFSTTITAP